MSAELLTGREVAGMLRRSPRWFYARRHDLAATGFPSPCTELGRTLWRRAEVEAWIAGRRAPDAAAAQRRPDLDAGLERAAKLL